MNKNEKHIAVASLPLVSVHIITYNQKEFIRDTLHSVLDQDYESVEIVVADDGSTDGTAEIIQEYARHYPGKVVPIVGGANLGITGNSNRGLEACKGKYIAWMGGDDLMLPGKLSLQVSHMEANPDCAICYHDLDVFDNTTGKTLYKFSEVAKPRQGGVANLIQHGCFNGACSTMTRRDCSPSNGFDARLPIASDWLYWIECMQGGMKIHYLDQELGRYRRHGNNITGNAGQQANYRALTDHFLTCAILKTKYPEYCRLISARESSLYRSFRFSENGEKYNKFLRASVIARFNFKSLLALLASYVFKIRR